MICESDTACDDRHRLPCSSNTEASCGACKSGYSAVAATCAASCDAMVVICPLLQREPCLEVPFVCGPCLAGYKNASAKINTACVLNCSADNCQRMSSAGQCDMFQVITD
jgi:hypothetical protein